MRRVCIWVVSRIWVVSQLPSTPRPKADLVCSNGVTTKVSEAFRLKCYINFAVTVVKIFSLVIYARLSVLIKFLCSSVRGVQYVH